MYIKTPNELAETLVQILTPEQVDEAMMNLEKLAQMCIYTPKKESHYPVFDKTKDSNNLLRTMARDAIEWRYPMKTDWC